MCVLKVFNKVILSSSLSVLGLVTRSCHTVLSQPSEGDFSVVGMSKVFGLREISVANSVHFGSVLSVAGASRFRDKVSVFG